MNLSNESLIEAALLTQPEPLSESTLRKLAEPPLSENELADCLAILQNRWQNRALQLLKTAQGWKFQIVESAFERLGSLNEQRTPRYSRAVMETLAIIAYQQPVTRGDIEQIRGVSVSQTVMQTLQERGWIEVIGQRDTVGKPSLWATTEQFLVDLQLPSLGDLPPLTELGELVLPETPDLPKENAESETE
ncbi:SMC-Scp complex subunit ScpB [Alysiella filiformis]|uniref:Segregation and condensation protein B n=1 Tax=Alysiella filiformis DSM 16848 TaxID=1120981 RepID=A0A286E5T9_9NEIS|nr:SMC-Scp complex subunit ScpB [Alysiella filiformis]QMT30344.1 SMC-Scp complex subunit ScpB [Alysiella filiformis]UBQ56679.1 SMC-Scp complex subunit ScpB [Alysiella filiformis DSM 16848]SOD66234.1 segregation and condensation protein B [Alysiella filiformis DSM 16848]